MLYVACRTNNLLGYFIIEVWKSSYMVKEDTYLVMASNIKKYICINGNQELLIS